MNLLDRNLNPSELNSKIFISLCNEIYNSKKSYFQAFNEYKNLLGNINSSHTINSFPEIPSWLEQVPSGMLLCNNINNIIIARYWPFKEKVKVESESSYIIQNIKS